MFRFKKYFKEIKYRLILIWISWISTVLVCYIYKEVFLFEIVPKTVIINNNNKQIAFFYFIFTDIKEILLIYFILITFLSFQILFFSIIYHFYIFISPALFQWEFLYLRYNLQILFIIWIVSLILVTYLIIPLSWNFFISFQNITIKNSLTLHFEAKIKEYIYFYIKLYYFCWFYIYFFLFFIVYFNFHTNIIFLKKYRKIYHYNIILLSTIISPIEFLSQLLFSLFIIFIYEFLFIFFLTKIYLKFLIKQKIKTN
jgi:sec-independent protein translocase protein TatC